MRLSLWISMVLVNFNAAAFSTPLPGPHAGSLVCPVVTKKIHVTKIVKSVSTSIRTVTSTHISTRTCTKISVSTKNYTETVTRTQFETITEVGVPIIVTATREGTTVTIPGDEVTVTSISTVIVTRPPSCGHFASQAIKNPSFELLGNRDYWTYESTLNPFGFGNTFVHTSPDTVIEGVSRPILQVVIPPSADPNLSNGPTIKQPVDLCPGATYAFKMRYRNFDGTSGLRRPAIQVRATLNTELMAESSEALASEGWKEFSGTATAPYATEVVLKLTFGFSQARARGLDWLWIDNITLTRLES